MAGNSDIRVLHAITRFPRGGGAERNTFHSVVALQKKGYHVDLLIGRSGDPRAFSPDISSSVIRVNSLVRDISPRDDLAALWEIYRIIKKGNYDIVHTHEAKAGVLGRFAAELAGVPVIVHGLHGSLFRNPPTRPIDRCYFVVEKLLAPWTTSYVSVGEDLRNKYISRRIGSPEQYVVVHSGMELDEFIAAGHSPPEQCEKKKEELGIDKHSKIVGMVAALEPRKGHSMAIDAAARVLAAEPDTVFVFVGEGHLRPVLEQKVKDMGLEDKIMFTGFRSDVPEITACFDVAILTSSREGLPQVLVQAAASGRPLVSFEVEGASDVIADGVNGFIVPHGDTSALSEKILFLLGDLSLAREMGARGREIVDHRWSIDTMTEKTCAHYAELADRYLRDLPGRRRLE
jgi:glycosyltransferase involved in cell wall biosynthesis